jgi:transposase
VLRNLGDGIRRVRSPGGTPSPIRLRPDRAASHERTTAPMAECFAAIHAAAGRGLSTSASARARGLHPHTGRQYLALDTAPERHHANRRVSILAPYEGSLLGRWRQGCRDARALWRAIAVPGSPGSSGPIVRVIRQLRQAAATGPPVAAPRGGRTPPQAVGLLLLRPGERTTEQEAATRRRRGLHPDIATARTAPGRFAALIRARGDARQERRLDRRLADAAASGLPALAACAAKRRQDRAAVRVGLTLPRSRGQTEGQILKLKVLLRQMYGRGTFDLVRKRPLRAA